MHYAFHAVLWSGRGMNADTVDSRPVLLERLLNVPETGNSHMRLYINCCGLGTKPLNIDLVSAAGGSAPLFGALSLPPPSQKDWPLWWTAKLIEFPSNGKDKNQQSIDNHCVLFLTCFHSDPLFYFSKNHPSPSMNQRCREGSLSLLSRRPSLHTAPGFQSLSPGLSLPVAEIVSRWLSYLKWT